MRVKLLFSGLPRAPESLRNNNSKLIAGKRNGNPLKDIDFLGNIIKLHNHFLQAHQLDKCCIMTCKAYLKSIGNLCSSTTPQQQPGTSKISQSNYDSGRTVFSLTGRQVQITNLIVTLLNHSPNRSISRVLWLTWVSATWAGNEPSSEGTTKLLNFLLGYFDSVKPLSLGLDLLNADGSCWAFERFSSPVWREGSLRTGSEPKDLAPTV